MATTKFIREEDCDYFGFEGVGFSDGLGLIFFHVDPIGLEPTTSAMRMQRSTR